MVIAKYSSISQKLPITASFLPEISITVNDIKSLHFHWRMAVLGFELMTALLYSHIIGVIFRRDRKNCERRRSATSCLSFRSSVRPSPRNNSAPTGRIFIKSDISVFFEKSVGKIQVSLQSDNNNGTLHEDRYTFSITFL